MLLLFLAQLAQVSIAFGGPKQDILVKLQGITSNLIFDGPKVVSIRANKNGSVYSQDFENGNILAEITNGNLSDKNVLECMKHSLENSGYPQPQDAPYILIYREVISMRKIKCSVVITLNSITPVVPKGICKVFSDVFENGVGLNDIKFNYKHARIGNFPKSGKVIAKSGKYLDVTGNYSNRGNGSLGEFYLDCVNTFVSQCPTPPKIGKQFQIGLSRPDGTCHISLDLRSKFEKTAVAISSVVGSTFSFVVTVIGVVNTFRMAKLWLALNRLNAPKQFIDFAMDVPIRCLCNDLSLDAAFSPIY